MKKFLFKAKEGGIVSQDKAQAYGERLYALMQMNDKQELTPALVVEDAKKVSVVYHDFFEWNNSVAGEKFRLDQARDLMRSIVKIKIVEGQEEPMNIRAFHCVSVGDNGSSHNAYVPEEIVFNSKDFSLQVIAVALDEARSWNRRYSQYKELRKISVAISSVLLKHDAKKGGGGKK